MRLDSNKSVNRPPWWHTQLYSAQPFRAGRKSRKRTYSPLPIYIYNPTSMYNLVCACTSIQFIFSRVFISLWYATMCYMCHVNVFRYTCMHFTSNWLANNNRVCFFSLSLSRFLSSLTLVRALNRREANFF